MDFYQNTEKKPISVKTAYISFLFPLVLMAADYCGILCAESLSFHLRNFFVSNDGLHLSKFSMYVICPVIYMLLMDISGLYTKRMQFWRIISGIFKANVYAGVSIVLLMYLYQTAGSTSRLFIGFLWIFAFVFIVLFRFIIKKILDRFGILNVPALIMGAGKTASLLLEYFQHDTGMGYQFIGYLEDRVPEPDVAAAMPCLGKFDDAEQVIRRTGVRHVIVAAPGLDNERVQEIIYCLQPLVKKISFIPELGHMPMAVMDLESLIDGHIVSFTVRNNLSIWYNRVLKRIFDMAAAMMGTLILSPFLLAIAIWVSVDSPGPVIFKHTRVGRHGKEFFCYKFRSMCTDADRKLEELLKSDPAAKEEWEQEFKLKHDPRITRSGRFLRKTSLDELPQLFNVLKGEMSLVGPRPIIQKEIPKYGKYIQDYYMVRPGITGMWQTSGRSDVDYDERVEMDTWYVRNWNMWFDMVLIWRTFRVVLGRKGAY